MRTDRMTGYAVRRPCGCYSTDDSCDCVSVAWPDPWLIAGEDVDLARLSETRSYRQSIWRNIGRSRR